MGMVMRFPRRHVRASDGLLLSMSRCDGGFEKPLVAPRQFPIFHCVADADKLVPVGGKFASFPLGDRPLAGQSDSREFGLGDSEHDSSDVQHGVHGSTIIRKRIIRQGILFGNEIAVDVASGPMEDVQKAIRALLVEMTQAELAKEIGVGQGTISKWLSGKQSPNKKQWDSVVALLPNKQNIVGIKGLIGAGGQVDTGAEQLPPDGNLYEIEVPFPLPNGAFAFEVSGESMFPRYDSGDVVICARHSDRPEQLIGKEAALQTIEGPRYLKKLRAGSRKGVFDLESHNAEPIRGVRLQWISPIHSVVRAGQWRKVAARSLKRGAK